MHFVRVPIVCLIFTVLAVGGLSCGSSGPTLFPVSGSVMFEGQPAEGATVILEPVDGGLETSKPSGTVAADGSFTVSTYPHGNGAPAGEYTILISWYADDARQLENPKNKLPDKYADAATTPLPKVKVQSGNNEIPPIKLTAK